MIVDREVQILQATLRLTVGWIDQRTMAGENAVNSVWSVVALEATVAAGSGRASLSHPDV